MPSDFTVLIVEDEPLIRVHLVTTLEGKGCKTLEAGSAKEAIGMLERHREITAVFTDIQMPGPMDGIQLAQYIRRRWPPMVIVVSSGKATPLVGALPEDTPFLCKPYDEKQLGCVIAAMKARLGPP